MKKLLTNLIIIIIIVGIVIFMQHKYFPTIITNTIHTSDTIYQDSIIVEYIPKPYPVYIDTSRVDTVYIPSNDSLLRILYLNLHQKYFSTYTYNDTIKNDSLAFIGLEAKITQNKPIFYKETYFDKTPSIINNTTNIYSKNEFYIGLGTREQSLNINLLLKSKNNYIFEAGYDPFKNTFEVKGFIDIKKLKLW